MKLRLPNVLQPNDLRIKILRHFESMNNSAAEFKANKWLHKHHKDLGTIRRSLIDLVECDFIRLSSIDNEDPVKWLEREWDTRTDYTFSKKDRDDKKSSKRLVQQVNDYHQVKEVRLFATIKGIVFYKDYIRFKYRIMTQFIFVLIAFVLGLFTANLTQSHNAPKPAKQQSVGSSLILDSINSNKETIVLPLKSDK